MDSKNILQGIIQGLTSRGADLVSCHLNHHKKDELSLEAGSIKLLRTTHETSVSMTAILNHKKGSIVINKLDKKALDSAMDLVIETAKASQPDPANIISEYQETDNFSHGSVNPDMDVMYTRLDEFNDTVKRKYPYTILEEAGIDFTRKKHLFLNSNETCFSSETGHYSFGAMFTTNKNGSSSSFNYTDVALHDIGKPLIDYSNIETLLKQSSEQTEPDKIKDKYTGHIIVTPNCAMDFFRFLIGNLQDHSMITETSVYKDKLEREITSPSLTLHAKPVSDDLVIKSYITEDGYPAENCTIVERGILKTFLLSLYGAEKTGLKRAKNQGRQFIIAPGDTSLENLVKSVKKGILVCRFSGGMPGKNGDFSGVAKNSYRIQNGEILNPVSETMISGNMVTLLEQIDGISSDRINFGHSIMPWIKFGGVTISG